MGTKYPWQERLEERIRASENEKPKKYPWQERLEAKIQQEKNAQALAHAQETAGSSQKTGEYIVNQVNNLIAQNTQAVTAAQQRYANRKNTPEDAYVADSGTYFETLTQQQDLLYSQANEILDYLSSVENLFDKEWVSSVRKTVQAVQMQQAQMVINAENDSAYWKQWENADAYKLYQDQWNHMQMLQNMDTEAEEQKRVAEYNAVEMKIAELQKMRADAYKAAVDSSLPKEQTEALWAKVDRLDQRIATLAARSDYLYMDRPAEIYNAQMYQKFGTLQSNADWAKYSQQPVSPERGIIDALNFNEEQHIYEALTEEEKKEYSYVYNKMGEKAAKEYLEYKSYTANARRMQGVQEWAQKFANDVPVLSDIASIPMNLVSGIGYLDLLGQEAKNLITGEYRPLDYNTMAMAPSVGASGIRGQRAQNIQQDWKKSELLAAFGIDENTRDVLGQGAGGVYQLGMSMADSAAVAALGKIGVPPAVGTTFLAGSAAAQGVRDAVARGATDEQALASGLMNGVFEWLFEKYEIDGMLGAIKDGKMGAVVKQAITEGFGEGATSTANIVADAIIMAEKSNWELLRQQYKASGMDDNVATLHAFKDMAIQVGMDTLGGMLMGGLSTGGAVAIDKASGAVKNTVNNYQVGKTIVTKAGGVEGLKNLAGSVSETATDSKAKEQVEKLAGKVTDKGGVHIANQINTGKLFSAIRDVAAQHSTNELAKNLSEKGFDTERATQIAEAVHAVTTKKATAQQVKMLGQALADNNVAQAIMEVSEKPSAEAGNVKEFAQSVTGQQAVNQMTDEEATGMAQRLSKVIGREIVMYSEDATENGIQNGYYTGGKIYINRKSGNPFAQIVAHELTHSTEAADMYADLSKEVLRRISSYEDLNALRKKTMELYAANGVMLNKIADADKEIVADWIAENLLTNEQAIRELCQEKPSLGRKILHWLDWLLAKFKNKKAKEREVLYRARNLYAQALGQSQQPGTAKSQREVQEQLEEIRQAYRAGELTEEEFDSIMDSIQEWEEQNNAVEPPEMQSSVSPTFESIEDADQAEKNTAQTDGVLKYSLSDGTTKDASELSRSDLQYLLECAQNGELSDNSFVPLRRNTPEFFIGVVKEHSKGSIVIEDHPMAATVEHLRQNMDEEDGQSYGSARPHGFSTDDIITMTEKMGDPSYIVLQKNGRYAEVVSFYNKRNKQVVVAIDFADSSSAKPKNYKHAQYMNGYGGGYYNIIVTQYEPDSLAKYLNDNEIVYDKKEMNGRYQVGSGRIVTITHDTPFIEDIVTDQQPGVKKFSDEVRDSRQEDADTQFSIDTGTISKKDVAQDLRKILSRGGGVAELRRYIAEMEASTPARTSEQEEGSEGARSILRAARRAGLDVEEYLAQNWEQYDEDGQYNTEAREALDIAQTGRNSKMQYSVSGMTDADIQAVQTIGRKSVNAFTSADVQATERFAKQYWKEMGTKSPFFRTWFGEWRESDQTPVRIATQQGDARGVQRNDDTGWDVQVSGKVFAESGHFAKRNTAAIPYLRYVNDIIRKAVLLDTYGIDSGKEKSQNSLLMHSLYAVADIGNGPELLKLYVEEMHNPNTKGTGKRAYQLQNIEKASAVNGGVQSTAPSSLANTTNAIRNVADLVAVVKQKDSNYQPKAASKVVNEDGTPKVMYHGSQEQFTVFDKKKAKSSGHYGRGFYFTDSESQAGVYGNQYQVYLNIRNPLEYGRVSVSREQVRAFLEAVAENEDYSIENYGTYNVDVAVGVVMGYADSIDAFQVIQDISSTAIGDMVEATELFNTVNDTKFDGIVVPTETVAFYPNQIKSATDNIGTFDGNNPDIRYSISEPTTWKERIYEGSKQEAIVEETAHKYGYPVIGGIQIVPFKTWVLCQDPKVDEFGNVVMDMNGEIVNRNNYGLVVGIKDAQHLVVKFDNKTGQKNTERGKKNTKVIATEHLTPVAGSYQMRPEEFHEWEKLIESQAIDPETLTAEELAEIEELRSRADSEYAGEPVEVTPLERETLPPKARDALKRAEGKTRETIGKALEMPKGEVRKVLQGVSEEMATEYLRTGRVSQETMDRLFDAAYEQAIVIDSDFYDQYEPVKKHLRTTPITISEQDKADIADFKDFRRRTRGTLRIVNNGGLPVDSYYRELREMAPELFPDYITHPADQLRKMHEVSVSIQRVKRTLDEYHGENAAEARRWAKYAFEGAVADLTNELWKVRRYTEAAAQKDENTVPMTVEEVMETYQKLKDARKNYEKVLAKNLLTAEDTALLGDLLAGKRTLDSLSPDTDNIQGIEAVYRAKVEMAKYNKLITQYRENIHKKHRTLADEHLSTANLWKDKKTGMLYRRETMRRNIQDIVPDPNVAAEINKTFFEPVQISEAESTRFKKQYRERVRGLNISRKVRKGDKVSEAYAVQLYGEAMDNIRMIEKSRGRMKDRDGRSITDWEATIADLWAENPSLDKAKIKRAVEEMRSIYNELFEKMNEVRVANGYEPVSYRAGYFPHFQAGRSDGVLAHFGRALGINTDVVALPTTINGLTHTFKPGIQWFGNAQERKGFQTEYDVLQGFDKYIEGVANVIHQTENIQRLRALATQVRYRTGDDRLRERVDEIRAREDLSSEDKAALINEVYTKGKFELSNFAVQLDEYTNLLAGKKSMADRSAESNLGRRMYTFMKWWEGRVGANLIGGNLSSATTNFIPLTQASARLGNKAMVRGMWDALKNIKESDALIERSDFVTNRRGSDLLTQTTMQKVSDAVAKPMEIIDGFVSESIVRAAYYRNLEQGMSEEDAMHQADIFAAGVMADRSKGAMPTLFEARNPWTKMFTQFQLEVNNQFSELFKDVPREQREKGIGRLIWVLFKYFAGAYLFNDLFERLFGRRPAMDPLGILNETVGNFTGYELPNLFEIFDPAVSFETERKGAGQAFGDLGKSILEQLPFTAMLTMLGMEMDQGRIAATSVIPDFFAILNAVFNADWAPEKKWKEVQDELNKLANIIPPVAGNQLSKTYKGIKAYIMGGSYTVDEAGNDVLQYPVYNDEDGDFWSMVRAMIMGKNSLPEAQDWVDSNFDGLSAKRTALYQELMDAGTSNRNAYGLVKELEKADALDGQEEKETQSDLLIDSQLSDEEKMIVMKHVLGDKLVSEEGNPTNYAKMLCAVETGLEIDEYLRIYSVSGDMDKYFDFIDAGMDSEDAADMTIAFSKIEPEVGAERITDLQKWKTCVEENKTMESQLAALRAVMREAQYDKAEIVSTYEIDLNDYLELLSEKAKYDVDGNGSLTQAEAKAMIQQFNGTRSQRAALWQVITGSTSGKNNPFDSATGKKVAEEIKQRKEARTEAEESEEPLTFSEEVMRQIMARVQ